MRNNVILSLLTLILVSIFSLVVNNFLVCFLFLVLNTILFIKYKNNEDLQFLIFAFSINIIFNLILNRIYIYEYGEPYFMGGSDDKWSFEFKAANWVTEFGLNPIDYISQGFFQSNSVLYVYIVSLFMKSSNFLGNYYTILPIFFNSFILVQIGKKIYEIAILHYGLSNKNAKSVTLIFMLFPLVMFMNSHVFRDTLVNYLIISIFHAILVTKSKFNFIKISLFLGLIFLLRVEYTLLFLVILLLNSLNKIESKLALKSIYFSLSIIISAFVLFNFNIINYFLGEMEMYDNLRVNVGSPLLGKIFSLPIYLRIPAKFIFLLLNPAPSFGTLEQTFIGLGTIIQFVLTPFTFYGIYLMFKKKDILAITFIVMFFMIGLISVDSKHKYSLIMLGIIPTYMALQKIRVIIK